MLYEIEIEGHAYVEAETEDDALEVFKKECGFGELRDLCDFSAYENPTALWGDWKHMEPYGSRDGKTVGQIFDEINTAKQAEIERKKYCDAHVRALPGM